MSFHTKFELDFSSPIETVFKCIQQQISLCEQICQTHPIDRKSCLSAWSLHQQLEHLNITGRSTPPRILEALQAKDSPEQSHHAGLLFSTFKIERFTEKAPEFSWPKGNMPQKLLRTFQRLQTQILELEPLLTQIVAHLGKRQHPILGPLSAREWLLFMAIHQNHHLQIILDILKN